MLIASLPDCDFQTFLRRYQMAVNPGFLERTVSVVVRTAASTSNAGTFTFRVQAQTVH